MHTPRPWQVTPAESLTNQRVYWIHASQPENYNGAAIVEVPQNVEFYGKAQSEATILANAHLIAAAPELLAALEKLSKRCVALDQSATHDGIENCNALAAARAAIAKAKGETP